ncbi:hypothetical protein HOD75_03455 [archaeon]|jgi:hypothetical protein|nr:hypothetical protein [archaeon]MBT4241930.1 hypothetical protein [archaeon]MBT4418477.1 hypothetical protein [archaeon]
MEFMFYPTFEVVEGRGILPKIYLPSDFEELVPKFYEQERRKTVEDYVRNLDGCFERDLGIRLNWDDRWGLRNISGIGLGLDLDERGLPNFQEHNLGGTGKSSFVLGAVAMKYVSELMKASQR